MTSLALAALLLLSGCSAEPPLPPGFPGSMGGPAKTAALSPPRPTVPIRNPFWCPRRAAP
jgi:hypothetical protein